LDTQVEPRFSLPCSPPPCQSPPSKSLKRIILFLPTTPTPYPFFSFPPLFPLFFSFDPSPKPGSVGCGNWPRSEVPTFRFPPLFSFTPSDSPQVFRMLPRPWSPPPVPIPFSFFFLSESSPRETLSNTWWGPLWTRIGFVFSAFSSYCSKESEPLNLGLGSLLLFFSSATQLIKPDRCGPNTAGLTSFFFPPLFRSMGVQKWSPAYLA